MKTLKQRTRVVRVFPNRASCERLIGALLLERHEKWQLEKQPYFSTPTRITVLAIPVLTA